MCVGSAAAMGETLPSETSDTDPGPPCRFDAFSGAWDARQAAETLWTLSRKAQRAAIRSGQALPGCQEGCLNPHEDGKRGSFAMDIKPITKLLCLKHKLSLGQSSCLASLPQKRAKGRTIKRSLPKLYRLLTKTSP